jgi:hypothetical protein
LPFLPDGKNSDSDISNRAGTGERLQSGPAFVITKMDIHRFKNKH